jgi:predicted Zn finger-like uncharacterized protein
MKIACPTCAAVYEVPAARLNPGRYVRCARCNAVWKPEPMAESARPLPPKMPAPPEPEPAAAPADAMQRLAGMPPPDPPRRAGLIAAWLASILVLASAGAGIVIWRDAIMRIWPASGRILVFLEPLPQLPVHMPGNRPQ